jgi:anaerobic magnesium-protoporphyrin IX monomethyl ester cyclase
MKVALSYPYVRDVYHRLGFLLPPLGLGYLAAVLRNHEHDVSIFDLNLTPGEKIPNLGSFDVVGISMDTSRHNVGIEIAKDAMSQGCTVVMGGPHATFLSEDLLTRGFTHYVVRGEGEESFALLVDDLEGGGSGHEVAGVSFKKGDQIIDLPDRKPPENLDDLPVPARDILMMERYKKLRLGGRYITSLITSRGCPHDCVFCVSTRFSGKRWRKRSARSIVDEIDSIVNDYGFGAVCFMDDNFTMNPRRVIEVCREIRRRSIDIYWWCFSRSDSIVQNENMVKEMSESGCRYVFMGMETASNAILSHMKGGMVTADAEKAVELLRDYSIETMGSFILGWPQETREMARETIRFSKKLRLGGAQFSILTPYPGTSLYEECKNRIFETNWEKFDCHHSVMQLDHLRSTQVEGFLRKAFFSFYFTPRRILTALLSPFRGRGVGLETIKNVWNYFRGK